MSDLNTSPLQLALNSQSSVDVYTQNDFGTPQMIDGEMRYLLENKIYYIHKQVICTIPLALPVSTATLPFVVISGRNSPGSQLVYPLVGTNVPFIYGRGVSSLFIDFMQIVGSATATPGNTLFDLEFLISNQAIHTVKESSFIAWNNLGRLTGANVNHDTLLIAECVRGFSCKLGNATIPYPNAAQLRSVNVENFVASSTQPVYGFSGVAGRIAVADGSLNQLPNQSGFVINEEIDLDLASIVMSNVAFNDSGPSYFFRPDVSKSIITITDSVDFPSTEITLNVINHSLLAFDNCRISGTVNYNSPGGTFYSVTRVIDDNNFNLNVAFVANENVGALVAVSANSTTIGVDVANCGDQRNSMSIGAMAIENSSVQTAISLDNVFNVCNGPTIATSNIERWTNQGDFQLRYDGNRPFSGSLSGDITLRRPSGGGSDTFVFAILVNGLEVFGSSRTITATATGVISLAISAPISMNMNDVVALYVKRILGSGNVIVQDAYIEVS